LKIFPVKAPDASSSAHVPASCVPSNPVAKSIEVSLIHPFIVCPTPPALAAWIIVTVIVASSDPHNAELTV
jgi:hypothetical protein